MRDAARASASLPDVQVGDAVIDPLAIIGLIAARGRASGGSHACSESVS